MSIRNMDRHGLANLAHDAVKPLDRLKIPPYFLYGLAIFIFLSTMWHQMDNEEMQLEVLARKNLLLAMKKSQDKIEYGENEISPAEEL